ncbi:hypothetical protein GGI07_001153 [Coemansia sp. Benny D115]|nr:hypothetical protein GGI07_001153 [Coemansia sp. Benny D115]
MLLVIFCVLAPLTLCIQRYQQRRPSPLSSLPGGLLNKLTSRYFDFIAALGRMAPDSILGMLAHGSIYRIQPDSVSISHPAHIRQVLGSTAFQKHPKYYRILQFTGTNSLMSTTDPEKVSLKRRMLGRYFKTTYINQMEPLILEHGICKLLSKWSSAGEVNFCHDFNFCTFSIISRLVFGKQIEPGKAADETIKWMTESTTYISIRAVVQLLPGPIFRLFTLMPWESRYTRIRDYVDRSVAERRLAQTHDAAQPDLLQALLDCEHPDSKVKLSDQEILAEALLLLIGGIDPTAYTLTWTLHLLMLYPEVRHKLQSELRQMYPGEGLITYNGDIRHSIPPLLEACLYESMRLIPVPCVQIPRACCPVLGNQGFALDDLKFSPTTSVFVNLWGSHHSPANWVEPEKFDPDRFIRDPRAKHSIFAFGHGTRICMGKQLAMMNMLTILANILRDYDMELPQDYSLRGPSVKGPHGLPRLMPMTQFLTAKPTNPDRDCRISIRKTINQASK